MLHLDFCPRLIYVLPMLITRQTGGYHTWIYIGLNNLQTLDIVWCGALREVFSLYHGYLDLYSHEREVKLPSLKHVHLHELPMLQGICGQRRIYTPSLETIEIRGCWSLRRLPFVWFRRKKKVSVHPVYNPYFSDGFSGRTVFFSHNKLTNSVFQSAYQHSRTGASDYRKNGGTCSSGSTASSGMGCTTVPSTS
jgi:hypothetical protein